MSEREGKYSRTPRITTIGGGTGSFNALQEFKYLDPKVKAIIAGADRGGHTGELRDEHGILPPGDKRQAYAALSESPILRDFFNYRFPNGESPGNKLLAAFELMFGKEKADEALSSVIRMRGDVIPVSLDDHDLIMHDGEAIIMGEGVIDHRPITSKNPRVHLYPRPELNPVAKDAILNADIVVLLPGSPFTSLEAALSVRGIATAFAETTAKTVAIANVATQNGQTDGWHVANQITRMARLVGPFDYTLYNNHIPENKELLERYADEGERLVDFSPEGFKGFRDIGGIALGDNFIWGETDTSENEKNPTLLRHDMYKVGQYLMQFFYGDKLIQALYK